MNNADKCAVVVLNYNDAETTLTLVNSIKDYDVFDNILIVDNCSTDGSWDKLSKAENQKIVAVRTENNGGYGAGNNFGVRYAKEQLSCKYVLIVNPDVSFEENIIKDMLEEMQKDPSIAVASPVQLDRNGNVIRDVAWKIPTIFQYIVTGEYLAGRLMNSYHYEKDSLMKEEMIAVDCVPGSLLLVDAEVFLQLGGYDERTFLYCEETVLGYKAKEKGYKTVLFTRLQYLHLHSVSITKSIKSMRRRRKLLLQSRLHFLKYYLKASAFEVMLAKAVYWVADIEQIVLNGVRSVVK